jgi:hypothetical protein
VLGFVLGVGSRKKELEFDENPWRRKTSRFEEMRHSAFLRNETRQSAYIRKTSQCVFETCVTVHFLKKCVGVFWIKASQWVLKKDVTARIEEMRRVSDSGFLHSEVEVDSCACSHQFVSFSFSFFPADNWLNLDVRLSADIRCCPPSFFLRLKLVPPYCPRVDREAKKIHFFVDLPWTEAHS